MAEYRLYFLLRMLVSGGDLVKYWNCIRNEEALQVMLPYKGQQTHPLRVLLTSRPGSSAVASSIHLAFEHETS